MTRTVYYQLITGQLYQLGVDGILHRCVLEHEREALLFEAHEGVAEGHNAGKATTDKVFCAGMWWPTVQQDAKEYYKRCDVCMRVGKPSRRDELPLFLVVALEPFEKWEIDFIGPINPPAWRIDARYIITMDPLGFITRILK